MKKRFLILGSVIALTSFLLCLNSVSTHSDLLPGSTASEVPPPYTSYSSQESMIISKKLDFTIRHYFQGKMVLAVNPSEVNTDLQTLDRRHLTGIIAIDDFRRQRNGAYFDENRFILETLVSNEYLIEDLFVVLSRNEKFKLLPGADNTFMKSEPQGVLNRMAAIDMLKAILDSNDSSIRHPKVLKGLQDMIMSPLSDQRSAENASTLGDRFDALALLGQRNPADALACFQFLKSSGHENIFKRALITGLKNYGLSMKDIKIIVKSSGSVKGSVK